MKTCSECNIEKDDSVFIGKQCKECINIKKYCPHGKQKHRCKECNGSSICIHEKEKYRCKECNGSQICPHEKFKQACRM